MAIVLLMVAVLATSFSLGTPYAVHYGCEKVGVLPYGGYTPQKHFYPLGSTVQFHCNEGYELDGATWTVCAYNRETGQGSWIHSLPTCQRKLNINAGVKMDSSLSSSSWRPQDYIKHAIRMVLNALHNIIHPNA